MTISEETRLLNYIYNVLRKGNILKRAIINYKIELNGVNIEPDFFGYLLGGNLYNSYVVLEFKKRTIDDDLERIDEQYSRYCQLNQNCLDSSRIPVISNIPIFINYIFYNTPNDILKKIFGYVNFSNDCGILFYETKGKRKRIINIFQNPGRNQNANLISLLTDNSNNIKNWENFPIPFTKQDLSGIKGLGGSSSSVKIEPRVSFSIIISYLCTFILRKKIRNEDSEFDTDTFLNFIFSKINNIIKFSDADFKNIIKKITLLLNSISKYCVKENFILIEKVEGTIKKYIIKIRRTDNLIERIESIKDKLYKKIKLDQSQKKIDEFF